MQSHLFVVDFFEFLFSELGVPPPRASQNSNKPNQSMLLKASTPFSFVLAASGLNADDFM